MRYKKIVVPLFLFFFVILISLIAIDSDSIDNDKSEYIEMEGLAKICNNNPSPFAIVDMIKEMNRDDIIELSEDSDPCGLLFSGILSKGKIRGFEVENNLEDMVKYTEDAWKFGAVDAGYGLFGMYYTGGVVNQNKELALRYLIESATLGYIRSQRKLGIAYRGLALRDLVNKDESEAFKWFLMAAEQGDRPSATNVAAFLHEGEIVNKDDNEAFQWFFRTESMPYGGVTTGFRGLAAYYEKGIGTDINFVQAYKYYDLLSPGSAPDKARLEEQMTPEQIREAIRLSRQWQEEHNIFVPSYYGLEYQEDGSFQ